MERKPKLYSSPKRNIYTTAPDIDEKGQSGNVKSHVTKKAPQKKKSQLKESGQRMEHKKRFEICSAEGSNKESKGLSHILELDNPVHEKKIPTAGPLFHNEEVSSVQTSKIDSFNFMADGGEPRNQSFFPSIEQEPLYSMALDREKLKHSEFWPFDISTEDEKRSSFPTPDLKSPSPHSSVISSEEKNLSCGKLKKHKATSTILKTIDESEIGSVEKKTDVSSSFDKCKAEGRYHKNQDSIVITDEKKGKPISPKHSKKKIKGLPSISSEEQEKSSDHGKIKNLFSLLNITDKEERRVTDKEEQNGTHKESVVHIKEERSIETSEPQTDEIKNDPVPEKKSASPIQSFLNRLNSSQRVLKNTIFDKANAPGDNLELFPFPPPKSKETLKNVIKASKTFIASGNKSSKNILKVNKATNVVIKRSKHEKKNRSLEAKKDEIKESYYELNIHKKQEFPPSTVRNVGSSSFDSISKPDHDKMSEISGQRPSSANMYRDRDRDRDSPSSRHGKRSRKQLTEHPSSRKLIDDKKTGGAEKLKSADRIEPFDLAKVTPPNLDEKVQSSKLDEKIVPIVSTKTADISTVNVEESSSTGVTKSNTLSFKNDPYIGVHVIQQDHLRSPPRNVHFQSDIPNIPGVRTDDYRIKKRIRDLLFYLVFLTLITLIALSMVSSNMFYFTDVTSRLFMDTNSYQIEKKPDTRTSENPNNTPTSPQTPKVQIKKSLRKSITIADFWLFAESVMIDLFYWKKWFAFENHDTHTEDDDRKFLYENVMLGVPRIRQIRVRDDSCHIHPDVARFFDKCYDYYTIFSEETKPIEIAVDNPTTKTAWIFTPANELGNSYYWGKISTYGGGGYYLDLSLLEDKTRKMIDELKSNKWLSRGTRAVFIDFTIYNANANLFCICKIVLEFPPIGGMIPTTDFTSVKLIRYLSSWDYFILGCEFVLILFVIFYTYEQVIFVRNEKIRYFVKFWNYVDIVILGLSYTYVVLNVVLFVQVNDLLNQIQYKIEEHIPFESIAYTQTQFNNVIAVLVFFCWVKLFKYLNFNKAMIELSGTLSRCMKDVFGFALMFFTIFIAFAQLAYLLFGTQVKDYSNVWSSCMALLQTLIGEFEYRQIEEANRILGPIFYLVFIFFIFFILLNMFLAIINDAYIAVKSEVKVHTDPLHFSEYTKRAFLNIIGCSCCGLDKKLESKSTNIKKNTYQELKEALKRAGYTDLEIEMFFTKYDIDINQLIEKGENKRIIQDLELRRLDFTDEKPMSELQSLKKEIERLNDKIKEMQRHLVPVIEKVDVLLRR